MSKKVFFSFFLFLLFVIASCSRVYITYTYEAGEGGNVYGELIQTVESGSNLSQVYAEANAGYRFVGWSDGNLQNSRIDLKVSESQTIVAKFEKVEYVTYTYEAEEGGNVYGELIQTVESGSNLSQVYAEANAGYRFVGWSDGNLQNSRIDLKVSESQTIVAKFEKVEYVTYTYEAEEGGNVYGELIQTVESGSNLSQVYAEANAGYRFVGWSDGNLQNSRIDLKVSESQTIVAKFEKVEYVTYTYEAEEGGNVYGELIQTVESGSNLSQVYAEANAGYRFVGWSDGNLQNSRIDLKVSESQTIVAKFEKVEYVTYTYEAEEGGNVYGELIQTVESGSNLSQVYAEANAGYRFVGWSDGNLQNSRIDLKVSESQTIVAKFEKVEYVTYTYEAEEGGNVYGELIQTVESGSNLSQVYAEANAGYRFVGWSDGNLQNSRIDLKVSESQTIVAKFEKVEYVTYTYEAEEGGNVYGELIQTVESGSNLSQVYAEANAGYRFVGWSDGNLQNSRIDLKVSESQTIVAKFEKVEYVTYTYEAEEGGNVYGELIQTVESGSNLSQVYAEANAGYRFVGWSDGNLQNSRIDLKVSESQTIVAKFEKVEYVTYTYEAEEGGNVYGELIQTVESGSNLSQVYAEANAGYRFVGWSDGNLQNSRIDLKVSESQTIVAKFEVIMVYMYSDDLIVRKYKLNDLCNIDDLSKVVGYKSYNSFKSWEFYKSSKSLFGSTTDALSDIVSLYRIKYNFLDDIYLTAVYEKNDDILPEDSKIVMHAAGGLNGKTYLDCLEAFEYWYAKGQRFFEFDFGITTDGYIVACHFVFDKTLEQIRKDMKGYTVLLLDDIIDLIDKYEDIIIDFDVLTIYELSHSNHVINYIKFYTELENSIKTKNNQKIYEQIILEILPNTNCEMFSLAKKYTNLKKFLYAEYYGSTTPINNKDDFENVLKWCNENGVQYLSIDNFNYEYGRLASKYNIKCFTFTYDNIEKIYEFLDMGCSGVFSNWIFI